MTSRESLRIINLKDRFDIEIIIQANEVLYDLVDRDTPMKPLLVETSTDNVHHYECLYCGTTINIGGSIAYNKAFNIFCRDCGQRLDWSNE